MTGNWGGGALGLIGLLGAFESMRERQRSLAESVYEEGPWNWASAPWGGEAKARTPPIWMELRRALIEAFGPSGRTADRAARGRRAKVIDASGREAQREALRRELDQAVAQEDFARAARLRDRLRDLDSR
ncbi:MAG: UvrB/uvrC motif protein [candidate division BRC1 bacterium ADurb.BinA364]|nr:MAG: UvrB/uvrC motif protein [candidate division BRC1 bacterium ADurb.BinA364]